MPATPGSGLTINEGFECLHGPLGDVTGYGGTCVMLLATAATLVGEAVYLSSAGHVTKGATANVALSIGVVVGGKATKGRTYPEVKMGQTAAAAAEDWVVVCVAGKVRCIADSAMTAGAAVGFGATAGRVDDLATDATTVVGSRLGKALTVTANPGDEVDVLLGVV